MLARKRFVSEITILCVSIRIKSMAVLNRRTKSLFSWKRCCNWETTVLSTLGEILQRAFNSEFLSLMKYNCTDVAPNDVIWKHELYFLIFDKKRLDSDVVPVRKVFNGSGGANRGSLTFPEAQHIPIVSKLNFKALQ